MLIAGSGMILINLEEENKQLKKKITKIEKTDKRVRFIYSLVNQK